MSLPVWFVTFDRLVFVSTPLGSKKVARVRNDARSSFLVEAGERWAELTAVHLTGTIGLVDDEDVIERIRSASDAKYAAFRTVASAMPSATREHYGRSTAYLCFTPDERIVSWDNARLFS
jgi:acyl-CoA synthetase (AMP-forming)/AMP-acid ligase II